ncbi:MAG: metallophosphoesterase [Deltaproteobacteria bacterium]|jgi:predicted MPP superfamily phosphohydrolase|nr:metallophosphoesterase [Deltaproteobacteria bacterium]
MAITPVFLLSALLIALAQFLAWRYFLARLKKRPLRFLMNFIYIIANLLGVYGLLSVYVLDFMPPSNFLWNFVVRPGIIWELTHLFWLLPSFLLVLLSLLWRFFKKEPKGLPKLFRAEKPGPGFFEPAGLCLILMLVLAFYGYAKQLGDPEVTRLTLNFPDLPKDLEGLKIAATSDFHYGRGQNAEELARTFGLIANEKPDLVLLLGNFVDNRSFSTADYKEPLKLVKDAPLGVHAVLGLRDHMTDAPNNVKQFLTLSGVRVLSDESVNVPDLPLTLVGFSDPGTPEFGISPLTLPDRDLKLPWNKIQGHLPQEDNFVLLMNSRPIDAIPTSERKTVDLYLAGHTKGGLFQLPWNKDLNLAAFFYDHSSGRYAFADMELYVNRGLAAPISPFRLFAWPEILVVTLRKGPREFPAAGEQGPGSGAPATPAPTPATPATPPSDGSEPLGESPAAETATEPGNP